MHIQSHIQCMNKRVICLLLILLLIPVSVNASKVKVKLSKCVDGDTARFIINDEEIKLRFLGINAPEIASNNKEAEAYGEEASKYVCNKLKKAEKIEIEYDEKSDKIDKYGRHLAYVFLDGNLLETDILKKGYAEVKYAKSSFKYYDELINAENKAKEKQVGIHSDIDYEEENLWKEISNIVTKYAKNLFASIFDEIFN